VRGGSVKYSGWGGDVTERGGAARGYDGGAVGRQVRVEGTSGTVTAGASTLHTLPADYRVVTIRGGRYYRCGGFYYRPVYRGGRLVYVRVDIDD
jgi:hypothetical protein